MYARIFLKIFIEQFQLLYSDFRPLKVVFGFFDTIQIRQNSEKFGLRVRKFTVNYLKMFHEIFEENRSLQTFLGTLEFDCSNRRKERRVNPLDIIPSKKN